MDSNQIFAFSLVDKKQSQVAVVIDTFSNSNSLLGGLLWHIGVKSVGVFVLDSNQIFGTQFRRTDGIPLLTDAVNIVRDCCHIQ